MDREESFRAACLAASVAVAWTAMPSTADAAVPQSTVYLRAHSLGSGQSNQGEYRFLALSSLTYISSADLGHLPTGDSDTSFNVQATGFQSYAIVGAGSGGGDWVSVTFNDQSGVGSSFATLFPGFDETAVSQAIVSGDSSMTSFFAAVAKKSACNTAVDSSVKCTCTHLSVGYADGEFTASFTPIPEPASTLCLAGFGFAASLMRRRPVA